MEFPDLGKHCSEETCKQLDFLPLRCGACNQDFCKDHFIFAAHRCPLASIKDVQVPECPLCHRPIPVRKGELPDDVVWEHMDRGCRSYPGSRKKIFKHRCSQDGCQRREMLPVVCDRCRSNFCLRHRHPLDHDCQPGGHPSSRAGVSTPVPTQAHESAGHALPQQLAQQLRYCLLPGTGGQQSGLSFHHQDIVGGGLGFLAMPG
ncbi:AN1-type zinc finger protein 2A isoform X2 [Echinops telfairi]|nr:AN1-type zinc finger protein 2A isoform X2 [Echinops telfairi]XP_045141529.1 AN1-type zinc finger protein 2A isoform X2 [Echinops telfairi]XP_045141535.1 AN1-type zinc finger protein 2A isoform X2 [Echinops telfairi]